MVTLAVHDTKSGSNYPVNNSTEYLNYVITTDFNHKDDYEAAKEWWERGVALKYSLGAAVAASEINNEYIKRQGHHEFITDKEGNQAYVQTKHANRDVVYDILYSNPHRITESHLNLADTIINTLQMEFMFKVLAEDENDFEKGMRDILNKELIHSTDLGTIAYIPYYYKREEQQKELRERSEGSKHIASPGKAIIRNIEILSKRESYNYSGYNINGITDKGERISFFTSKEDIALSKGIITVSAKVKSHGTVYQDPLTPETRLNYVKIITE